MRSFNNQLQQVSYGYYRTQNKAEIDLIFHGRFGVIPIEIKFGSTTEKKQLRACPNLLKKTIVRLDCWLTMITRYTKMTDKIYQLPAIYL